MTWDLERSERHDTLGVVEKLSTLRLACNLGLLALAGCRASSGETRRSWDGKTALTCNSGDSIELHDCKAELPGQTAITAGNGCKVRLERCTISAEIAVAANNGVKLTLIDTTLVGTKQALALWNSTTAEARGGRLEGSDAAIYATNHVRVAVSGTAVVGPIQRDNDSEVTGVPEAEREQATERLANAFGPAVCDLALGCYGDRFLGALAGRFTVELAATGAITGVTFEGEAPAAAKECLTTVGTKQLAGFTGPPGALECAYAGQIGPTSRELDRAWTFEPRAER